MQLNTIQTDSLFNGKLKILQDKSKFCYGIDAVLLADFARPSLKTTTYDLGTGNGIIPLIMSFKNPGCKFTGIEIQEECVELAREAVKENSMENSIQIIQQDIKGIPDSLPANSSKAVVSNPPYMSGQLDVLQQDATAIQIARHEILCSLDDVCHAASHLLNSSGSFYMIHRPQRLSEIFLCLAKYKLEPKRMRLVLPAQDSEPTMVMIESVKCGKPGLKIEKPLVVYQRPDEYTDEVKRIYGRG